LRGLADQLKDSSALSTSQPAEFGGHFIGCLEQKYGGSQIRSGRGGWEIVETNKKETWGERGAFGLGMAVNFDKGTGGTGEQGRGLTKRGGASFK